MKKYILLLMLLMGVNVCWGQGITDTTARRLHIKAMTILHFSDCGKMLKDSTVWWYNTNGEITKQVQFTNEQNLRGYPLQLMSKEYIRRNNFNQIVAEEFDRFIGGKDSISGIITYTYSPSGRIETETDYADSVPCLYTYTKRGDVSTVHSKYHLMKYVYNAHGDVIKTIIKDKFDQTVTKLTYNKLYQLVASVENSKFYPGIEKAKTVSSYNDKGQKAVDTTVEFEFNKQTDEKPTIDKYVSVYYYNSAGLMVKDIDTYSISTDSEMPRCEIYTYTYTYY